MKIISYILCCLFCFSCKNGMKKISSDILIKSKIKLPKELNEISGLSFTDKNTLVGVQDEKGFIYFINTLDGSFKKYKFGKNGDYEGVCFVNNHIFVLESNGNLHKLTKDSNKNKYSKETFKFSKNANFDFEGLTFNSQNNELLVACKSHGNYLLRDKFYVYSFSLENNSYSKDPYLTYNKKDIKKQFKPSGIHYSKSELLYILSSTSKQIALFKGKNHIKTIKLDDKIFEQPEGITADKNGDIWICSEKGKKSAKLLQVKINEK